MKNSVFRFKRNFIQAALFSLFLITVLLSGTAYASGVLNDIPRPFIEGAHKFGFDIFGECLNAADFKKNVFISPYSISSAVTLIYNGSAGLTKTEIEKALHFGGTDTAKINAAAMALRKHFEGLDKKIDIGIANSMWSKKELKYNQKFLAFNKYYQDAEIKPLESASIINDWVKQKTREKIDSIVTDSAVNGSVMILVNAIYFKGKWSHEFKKENTKDEDFNTPSGKIKRPMMSDSGSFNYFEDKTMQAVRLPYGDQKISMYVFLPAKNSSLKDMMAKFDDAVYRKVVSSMRDRKGLVKLPRFRMEYERTLNGDLKKLGIKEAFGTKADFGKVFANAPFGIMISLVIHKTFVEVNEEGTEAAAVTAISMLESSAVSRKPSPPFEMIVDRPFFFVIADGQTNSLLFMGAITEPK